MEKKRIEDVFSATASGKKMPSLLARELVKQTRDGVKLTHGATVKQRGVKLIHAKAAYVAEVGGVKSKLDFPLGHELLHPGPNKFRNIDFSEQGSLLQGGARGEEQSDSEACIDLISVDSYVEEVLEKRHSIPLINDGIGLRFGLRIKVSGAENLVLRGASRLLRENVIWLHITVLPECDCVDEVKSMLETAGKDEPFLLKTEYSLFSDSGWNTVMVFVRDLG